MTKCNEEIERPRKKSYVDKDGILIHEESWYRDREHWSEKHGWN